MPSNTFWPDLFKVFNWSFQNDPISKGTDPANLSGAGVNSPEGITSSLGQETGYGGEPQHSIRLRDTNEMVDFSAATSRMNRYKEYERLRVMPEIESAMTIIADEACIAGNTLITTAFGEFTIEQLEKTKKNEKFLVYSWNEKKGDYDLAWAYDPRIVKEAKTICIMLDDGTHFEVTPDHHVLLKTGKWTAADNLKFGDELMPFYRIKANKSLTKSVTNQFPRVFTFKHGWIHERQFMDEWKGDKIDDRLIKCNEITRMLCNGVTHNQIAEKLNVNLATITNRIKACGFSTKEIKYLSKKSLIRKVIGVTPGKLQKVYDLSVEGNRNFCTNSIVMHNCQKDDEGNLFKISVKNEDIKKELSHVFYNKSMMNLNRIGNNLFKQLCIKGDLFLENIIDPENPKDGIYRIQVLPCETMWRIETTKGRLVEFQQSREGPDYQSIANSPVAEKSNAEIMSSTAIRFHPTQIVHMKIGDDRQSFYPYGVSLIEPARAPAHQLRLMEDSMVVYRLVRATERRVFYIDTGTIPPNKVEAYMERIKDQLKKRKVATNRAGLTINSIDERFAAPAVDEDFWVPVRPGSSTRIDTLQSAQALGEIDDAIYFRQKLYTALNFPKNYLNAAADVNTTKISVSMQDINFARMVERLQSSFEDGLMELAERHLTLRGYPKSSFDDLKIKMTYPSEHREFGRAEIINNRINTAQTLKSMLLYSDYDILTKILKHSDAEAKEIIARSKIQKLEELKFAIMGQNPALLGLGIPGQNDAEGQEMGTEAGGPNPMLNPDGQAPDPNADPNAPPVDPNANPMAQGDPSQQPQPDQQMAQGGDQQPMKQGSLLKEPTSKDIEKYNLELQNYDSEIDNQEPDYSVEDS
jgi:hypothetical protein